MPENTAGVALLWWLVSDQATVVQRVDKPILLIAQQFFVPHPLGGDLSIAQHSLTFERMGPWLAFGAGDFYWIIEDCSPGHRFRLTIC